MTRKEPDYVAAAAIPPEHEERYRTTLAALYGALSVTEAAERLGLSRNRFQTLMHRGQRALVEAILPQPAGRPAKPARETELEARVAKLERANQALQEQVAMAENLFGAAGEMLRSIRSPRGRAKRTAATPAAATKPTDEPEDPEPAAPATATTAATAATAPTQPAVTSSARSKPRWPRWSRRVWREATEMGRQRWTEGRRFAAALLGVGPSTLRRWRAAGLDEPPAVTRAVAPPAEACAAVEQLVRESQGLIGAAALRCRIPGVSRRAALEIKSRTLLRVERERRARCARVEVVAAGAVRGFDQMYVWTTAGWRYLLVCGDAAVPYRTTIDVVERYDGAAVAACLARDIAEHGAPLVYRLDRAACHDVPEVHALLARHGVLILHGPPRHPGYYGQLERQNREHRAWLDRLGTVSPAELAAAVPRMMHALNGLWPRRKLDWSTPEERWMARMPVTHDRHELGLEVADHVQRLRARGGEALQAKGVAERIAIEHALRKLGLLSVKPGEGAK